MSAFTECRHHKSGHRTVRVSVLAHVSVMSDLVHLTDLLHMLQCVLYILASTDIYTFNTPLYLLKMHFENERLGGENTDI